MNMSARIIRGASGRPPFAPLQLPRHDGETDCPPDEPAPPMRQAEISASKNRYNSRGRGTAGQTPSQLIANAREEANAIVAAASSQAAEIEAAARAAGYQAGSEEALAAAENQLTEIKATYQDSILKLDRLRHEMAGQCEQEIIQLVLEVAKKVVQREVSVDREIAITLIRVALARIGDNTPATIRVHHDDYKFLEARRNEFLTGENGIVHLVEDRSISRGGCIVETEFGQIDARIEQQFKEIERGFLGMG